VVADHHGAAGSNAPTSTTKAVLESSLGAAASTVSVPGGCTTNLDAKEAPQEYAVVAKADQGLGAKGASSEPTTTTGPIQAPPMSATSSTTIPASSGEELDEVLSELIEVVSEVLSEVDPESPSRARQSPSREPEMSRIREEVLSERE